MEDKLERLQKYLARCGIASRRRCEEIIQAGRVKVNGAVIRELGFKVIPQRDVVEVDGHPVKPPDDKIYIMLNKPRGYVTTLHDPQGRPKVVDLLRGVNRRVFPVGRLDFDSEGLLLLTDDGDLAFALTHPRHRIKKTYLAWVKGVPDKEDLHRLATGVLLEDGMTAPAEVRLLEDRRDRALIEITIHEGRNRQVRRMCTYIGHPVISLKRVRLGPLKLGSLKSGQFRYLTFQEVQELKKQCGFLPPQ